MRHAILAVMLLFCFNAQGAELKNWTVLVYLNGHNNLSNFGAFNINEMERIGSTEKVDVVVQWATEDQEPNSSLFNPKYTYSTKRIYVVKNESGVGGVTSPTLQTMHNVDMGNPKNIVDFISWGAEHFPAKHYLVAIWDHGGGWHFEDYNPMGTANISSIHAPFPVFGFTDISWDDRSGNFVSTADLGNAMYQAASLIGQKIDVYGSDACLMAMPEVSTEMRKAVNYFVGSEQVEPGQGWPYYSILLDLNTMADDSPANVAKMVVKNYVSAYAPNGEHKQSEVTFSALDLQSDNQVGLLAAIKNLATAVMGLNVDQKNLVVTAIQNTQSFDYNDYGDLPDFLNQIDALKIQTPALQTAILQVRTELASLIIAHAETSTFANAHGLSMWLPKDNETFKKFYKKYQTLDFTRITGWGDALNSLNLTPQS